MALSPEEEAEIRAEIEAAEPLVDAALPKIRAALEGLPDVAQKYALTLFVASWIKAATGEKQMALDLSEHFRSEVDKAIAIFFWSPDGDPKPN